MGGQLVADHFVAPLGIAIRTVDDVDEDASALHVAKERVAQTGPGARAFDQTGNVRDGGPAVVFHAQVEHAQVRFQRRERIVGDLGQGRGQSREQRRLARVRQTDQSDVGDEPKLEADPALLARFAHLGVARGLVRGSREVDVAEPAPAASGDHQGLLGRHEVAQELARVAVEDARPRRHLEHQVVARLAVLLLAGAAAAGRGLEVVGVAEVAQARLARIDGQVDGTAPAAVAAVGAAARHVGFVPERGRSIAAVAASDPDSNSVKKHGSILACGHARGSLRQRPAAAAGGSSRTRVSLERRPAAGHR